MKETTVIAGAGHAAGQAAASLRQGGYAGNIILVGDEPHVPYQRPPLSKKFLAGELEMHRLYFRPQHFYADHDIDLRLSTRAKNIDRNEQNLLLDDGTSIHYDSLLLTTGSQVRKMDVPGGDLDGISYLRTIKDVLRIRQGFRPGARVVIVGAGYIGLEVAAVSVSQDINVTVLEMEDRAMQRAVGPATSDFFAALHRRAGVDLRFGYRVESFSGRKSISAVVCQEGERFEADLVIVGIGIEPRTELAERTGLACDNGIVVDESCVTEDPHILAAGDCTNHPNAVLGRRARLESVHSAVEQAKIAAATICGKPPPVVQPPWFWSDQYDVKLQIVGLAEGYDQVILRGDPESQSFAAFYLANGRLLAVDAVNRPREFTIGKKLIAQGVSFDPEDLGDQNKDFKQVAQRALDAATGIN